MIHVVEQLEQAAGAGLAEVEDVGADVLEERPDTFECLGVAAAQNGQRARFGAGDAAGDGGVDVGDPGVGF